MAIQRIAGTFRTYTAGGSLAQNATDGGNVGAPNAVWSAGSTIIDPVNFQPPQMENWRIIGFGMAAGLAYTGTYGLFGKFGKIVCGLIVDGDTTSGPSATEPFTFPMLPLPSDDTLLADLWDPDLHPLPPNTAAVTPPLLTYLPVEASVALPLPLDLLFHNLSIGIWMKPSLIGMLVSPYAWQLSVCKAHYTVVYDDNRGAF